MLNYSTTNRLRTQFYHVMAYVIMMLNIPHFVSSGSPDLEGTWNAFAVFFRHTGSNPWARTWDVSGVNFRFASRHRKRQGLCIFISFIQDFQCHKMTDKRPLLSSLSMQDRTALMQSRSTVPTTVVPLVVPSGVAPAHGVPRHPHQPGLGLLLASPTKVTAGVPQVRAHIWMLARRGPLLHSPGLDSSVEFPREEVMFSSMRRHLTEAYLCDGSAHAESYISSSSPGMFKTQYAAGHVQVVGPCHPCRLSL